MAGPPDAVIHLDDVGERNKSRCQCDLLYAKPVQASAVPAFEHMVEALSNAFIKAE
jgi:hypothetical protein